VGEQRRTSVIGIAVVLVVAGLMVLAGSDGSVRVGGVPVFALCGVLAFVVNWIVFVPSNAARTEHYFDLTGAATYISVIVVAASLSDDLDTRGAVVTVMVVVWALRLGSFLFRRVKRDGRDGRFDRIKLDPLRFFMTWTLQGLWVLLTLACALAIVTGAERESFDAFAVVGTVVWALGFALEVVADQQKSAFRNDPANAGRFISSGLWSWSRHPNYFGEIMLWTGIAIMAIPVLSGWRWAALVSPVFVTILLVRISGVPALERRGAKRWGDDPTYQDYVRSTSLLVPRPPSSTR
jgi:steroid 5-alpha reductase family enzyme